MPSGSKRRKAAKKKKENQPNNNPNSSSVSPRSHGDDDDVKHQDDVGEFSSPGSQEEIETGENIAKIEVVEDSNKEGIIVIEREIKRKSDDGGSSDSSSSSSSSSSSGSDDEAHDIKSGEDVVDNTPVLDSVQVTDEAIYSTATEEAHDSVEEIIAEVQSLKEEVEVSTDFPANSYVPPVVVESVVNEEIEEKKVEDEVEVLETSNDETHEIEEKKVKDEVEIVEASNDEVITSVENVIAISETKETVVQEVVDVPIAIVDDGADIQENSGVTEPLLAPPAPHPIEKTSWKSCCGLFEVFGR